MWRLKKHILFTLFLVLSFAFSKEVSAEKLRFEYKTFVGGQTTIGDGRLFFHNANFFRAKEGYFLNHTQLTYQFLKINKIDFWAGYKQEYVDFPFRE
jgi:hypothetical protein